MLKLMRPGDWTKNIFVLPALVFSLPSDLAADGDPASIVLPLLIRTLAAFAAFCLISSGFYAINDVLDAEEDRQHPVKRRRPVASGAIPAGRAVVLGVILIALSLALAALVNWLLVLVLMLYAALQASYNLRLKRVMLVDVVAVATGFALRATAGAVAIEVRISVWLLLCVFFLCLFLGFIKRLCDLSSAAKAGDEDWKSPAGYDDRMELNWLLGISAMLAIVTYLMYALSIHARALFGSRAIGFALLSPLVVITIHRFYRRASRGDSDSPLAALLEDRVVFVSVLLFSAGVVVTLFVPAVQQVLDELFIAEPEFGEFEPPMPRDASPLVGSEAADGS
jgi:4-hydroxybenzoate polyprenyltransferase